MRIISQDGTLDLPYERFVISVNMQNQGEIIAWTGNHISDDECIVMAVYSSFAKAQKAMEMLRNAYVNNEYYKSLCSGIVIPLPNNSDDMKEKTAATHTFRATTIFQFPKDEDLEE